MKQLKMFLGVVILTVLTGCETLVTRSELRETDQKKQFQEQVSTLQKSNADVNSRFSDIEQDLRGLNGRVEVVETKLNQNTQEAIKAKALTEQSNQEQSKKVQILQEEVSKLNEQVVALTAELGAVKTVGETADKAEKPGKSGKKDHLEMAEEYFSKKEWKKAIVSYQKFRDANSKSKKFADVTYKIGVCFQELGLKEEAKTFFDEVIAKYPGSAEAKRAKTRLKSLKK